MARMEVRKRKSTCILSAVFNQRSLVSFYTQTDVVACVCMCVRVFSRGMYYRLRRGETPNKNSYIDSCL